MQSDHQTCSLVDHSAWLDAEAGFARRPQRAISKSKPIDCFLQFKLQGLNLTVSVPQDLLYGTVNLITFVA